ncbi:Trypsin-1, partial [Orchesella cincta]
ASQKGSTKFVRQYHPRYQIDLPEQTQNWNISPLKQVQDAVDELQERIVFEGITGRIVGGRDAKPGELPYQLRIIMQPTPTKTRKCGASLVEAYGIQFGLTAAHCLWSGNYANISETSDVKIVTIRAGVHNVKNYTETAQFRYPSKLVNYPSFNIGPDKSRPTKDIGILFFKKPFNITKTVSPIQKVVISGWGLTSSYGKKVRPDILQVLESRVLPHKTCKSFEYDGIQISEKEMCVFADGAGACSGDSGGPAKARNMTNKRTYLAGITTFGLVCVIFTNMWNVRLGLCGSKTYPTLYLRVSSYINWIQRQVTDYKNSLKPTRKPVKK